MGIISINWKTGDITTPRSVAQDIDPLTGKGRSYQTRWVKAGSALQKALLKPLWGGKPFGRWQTRKFGKPRKPLTKRLFVKNKKADKQWIAEQWAARERASRNARGMRKETILTGATSYGPHQ